MNKNNRIGDGFTGNVEKHHPHQCLKTTDLKLMNRMRCSIYVAGKVREDHQIDKTYIQYLSTEEKIICTKFKKCI